jgi:hypothetical protein
VALDHLAVVEVDLGEDAEAADDPGDRVSVHLDDVAARGLPRPGTLGCDGRHAMLLPGRQVQWGRW